MAKPLPCLLSVAIALGADVAHAVEVGYCSALKELEAVKAAGFDYAELRTSEVAALSDADFEALAERLQRLALPVPVSYLFVPREIKLTGPAVDEAAQMAYVSMALDRVARLGARTVVLGSGPARNFPEGYPKAEAYRQFVGFCKRVGPEARARGITIAIEPQRKQESNLINNMTEGLALVRDVNDPNVQLTVDFYHVAEEKEDPAVVLAAKDYVRHVHMANPVKRVFPLRWDEFDYGPFFANLRAIGYAGRISLEAGSADFAREAPVAIALLKRALARDPGAMSAADAFFPAKDMMTVGVYYYPEAWPRGQWARDLANIRKHGFEFVHIGEFAWAFMEPEEGRYDFEWLETNVRLAAEQGLEVVLCTPSATPPAWLSRKHPEILMVDARGRRMNHGSREHATWSSPVYRQHVERINAELARRFGANPTVVGWQIDNELSHYGKTYSYAPADRDKFRLWLRSRYGDVRRLNEAWGNAFWSQIYNDFDQIDIPNPEELVAAVNEHALLDFQRFFAEEAADFIRFQAGTLRRFTKSQWVTSNFMHLHKEVYPPLNGEDLDIITWTLYPAHGNLNQGPLGFRLGDGTAISFMGDFARTINGKSGLMELQPGQVNWGEVNPQPYPGAMRNWVLRAFAMGSKLLCTYRYRQPLFGNEQMHAGIVGTDGVTLSRGGEEWVQAMRELRVLRENRPAEPREPARYTARRSAILYNVDNRFDLDNHKQTSRWDTMGHIFKYQRALKSAGAPVDVITEDKDFTRYPFLIAPALQLVDAALVARLRTYAEGGGHLILSTRTGLKDRRGHLWEGPWAAPILDLIGADIRLYDVLPLPYNGRVKSATTLKSYEWGVWADVLKPRTGTTVLARHEDQFYAGEPTAVTRKLGKGTVSYVGVETLSGDLEKEIVRKVFADAGVAIESYPDQLFVDWRDGFWIASNSSSVKQAAPIPPSVTPLVGPRELPAAGVAIWRE